MWTDSAGIMVATTFDYLGVNYHIAWDNTCSKKTNDPILVLEYVKEDVEDDKVKTFHIGYFEDKHFQSFEYIPGKSIPCCKIP